MLPRWGVPNLRRTESVLLIAFQKWSTCRMPASYTAAISGHDAFECPHVTKQPTSFAARQNSTAPDDSARERRPILGRIRVPLKTLRMSANFVRREVRTIPMHACDPSAVLDFPV